MYVNGAFSIFTAEMTHINLNKPYINEEHEEVNPYACSWLLDNIYRLFANHDFRFEWHGYISIR